MTRVLFLCTGNSARSQMAEALLRRDGGEAFEVRSAGTEPKGVHPLTIAVMGELGLDLSGHESTHVDRYTSEPWDYVITVCGRAERSCPTFPGETRRLHWPVDDPDVAEGGAEEWLAAFRAARDELVRRIGDWLRVERPGTV